MPLSRGLFPVSSLLCVPFTILFHFTISFYSIRIFKIMINSEVMIMLVSFVSNRVILFFPLVLGNVLGGAADFILPSKLHRFLIRTGAELIEKFVCCLFMKVVLACQEDRPQQLWVRPRYACLVKPVLLDPSCSSRISTRRYIHLMAKSINTCLRVCVCVGVLDSDLVVVIYSRVEDFVLLPLRPRFFFSKIFVWRFTHFQIFKIIFIFLLYYFCARRTTFSLGKLRHKFRRCWISNADVTISTNIYSIFQF